MILPTHMSALISVLASTVISQLHLRQQDVEPNDVLLFLSVGDTLNFMPQVTIVHRNGVARKAQIITFKTKQFHLSHHVYRIELLC